MNYILVNGKWYALGDDNCDFLIFGKNCDDENYFDKYYDINIDKLMERFPSYVDNNGFSEGRIAVKGANGKWGFLSRDGECFCPCKFDYVEDFYHGISIVKMDDLYGVIDIYGNFIIPCVYKDISYYGSYCEYLLVKSVDNSKRIDRISDLIGDYFYYSIKDFDVEFEDDIYLSHDNMVVKHEDNILKLYQVDTKKKIVFDGNMFSAIKEKLESDSDNKYGIKVFDLNKLSIYDVSKIVYFDTDNIYKALRKRRGM